VKNSEIKGIARRIGTEELDTWIASPMLPSEAEFEDWVEDETDFVSNIPIKNLIIFEQNGQFPGKLAFVHEETKRLVFLAPAIRDCSHVKSIALSLFHCAISEAKTRSIPELTGIIDNCNEHCDILKDCLLETGFVEHEQKIIYRRNLKTPLICKEEKTLEYRSLKELDDESLKEGQALYYDSSDSLEQFKNKWFSRGKHWKLVFYEDRLVGLSFLNLNEHVATLDYLAVDPEVQGQGFGNAIFVSALNFAISMGATRYIDSTNTSNTPMIKILEKNGCKKYISRTEYIYYVMSDNLQQKINL